MTRWLRGASFALAMAGYALPGPVSAKVWGAPEPVAIDGYDGHAMEPFISCDGQVLLFNNRNDPPEKTDIRWAERISDTRFKYRGTIANANSKALDGAPTMDCQGNLYFISTRTYFKTLSTIYGAKFDAGTANEVHMIPGLATAKTGLLIFDVEISPDGNSMYAAEGTYDSFGGPWAADLFLVEKVDGRFVKSPRSVATLANVNTDEREYAASVSRDGLELFFTRLGGWSIWPALTIEHSVRRSTNAPWPKSTAIQSISGFVEAPSLAPGGKRLYFHRKMEDGMHRLFLVRRP